MTTQKRITLKAVPALLALAFASASCYDTTGTSTYYYDPYLYSYYYPADVAYSSYYYTDTWFYDDLYFNTAHAAPEVPARFTVGGVLRDLARGEQVCPGQVTVTPKTAMPACAANDVTSVRAGTTIVFAGCHVPSGGTVDGTVEVTATHTASEAVCSANTTITVMHTTTVTNLVYKGPDGQQFVIPTMTDTGTNAHQYGQNSVTVNLNSKGRFQYFQANNNLRYDQNFDGVRSFKFAGSGKQYTVDGVMNAQDNLNAGVTATLTAAGLTRTSDCCHPTSGTLAISRKSGSSSPEHHDWIFGPSCGAISKDGTSSTLAACE
jgi:hypothetical protein